MPQENVGGTEPAADVRALAEAAYGALNAGDLDAFLALLTEDVEFTSMVAEAEGDTFHGHDGAREWWATVLGMFEDTHWELLGVRAGAGRNLTRFRMSGTLSGLHVQQEMWQVVGLRGGKIAGWDLVRSEREALDVADRRA